MGGQSDQEKAAERQYQEISRFNPNVRNRFDQPGLLPHDPGSLLPAHRRATEKGVRTLGSQTDKNIKTAQKSVTAGGQSRGLGGSILEDAVAKARAKESEGGTSAINKFLTNRLGQESNVMNQANQTQLALTGGAQGADFENIMNMFRKFGAQGGAISGLDDSTFLTDLLAVANTAGNFVPLLG